MKPSVIFGQLFGFLTRLRIRHKLGIAFVSFSILPVMVVGGYSWYVGSRFMRDSAINELSNVTNTIKRRLIDFGDAIDSDLNTLLMFFQPREGSEPGRPVDPTDLGVWEDRALLFMYTRQHYARLTYITELNIEGLLHLHRDPYNRSRITSLPSNYSWYYYKLLIDDLAQGRSRMSPVEHLDPASGQPFAAFTFAIPDRDESGDLRGILIADVFADYVFAIIESALIGREHYTAGLIDRDGNYLYHSARKQEWNRMLVEQGAGTLQADFSKDLTLDQITSEAGVVTTSSGDVVYHTPLDIHASGLESDYYFYLSQPGKTIFATPRKLGLVTLALMGVFGVLALLLSGLATSQFVIPINDLQKGSDIIASGTFSHRLSISSGDEIEDLARKFNEMASFIQARDKQLLDYSTNLERLVAERTEQLRKEQQQMLQAEKLATLGEMAAVIAHEIRNSLTSANMLLQLINESEHLEKDERKSLAVVLESIGRINKIATDLLTYARPDPLEKHPENLEVLLRNSVSLHRHQFEKSNITTHIHLVPNLPEVQVDHHLMQEVMINILLNASQAIERDGHIEIAVKTIPMTASLARQLVDPSERNQFNGSETGDRTQSDHVMQVVIQDDGPGISTDVITKIFDPFFTTKAQGTGLGLSMARRVIESHGGSIQAKNDQERGAIFTIILPLGTQS